MGKQLCDKERGELDMIFSFEHMEVDQFVITSYSIHYTKLYDGRYGCEFAAVYSEIA